MLYLIFIIKITIIKMLNFYSILNNSIYTSYYKDLSKYFWHLNLVRFAELYNFYTKAKIVILYFSIIAAGGVNSEILKIYLNLVLLIFIVWMKLNIGYNIIQLKNFKYFYRFLK